MSQSSLTSTVALARGELQHERRNGKIPARELLRKQFPEPDPVGIEAYYVEEGKGKDLNNWNKQNLSAEIGRRPLGQPKLVQLIEE